MTDAVIAAARALSDVLAQENAALEHLDVLGANLLLVAKQTAFDALLAAQRNGPARPTPEALAVAERLRTLADSNKRLLERAMAAQTRVMACIARAIPKAVNQTARYGAGGLAAGPRTLPPVALSSRA